jgi:fructose-1,6-bisphosphatase/sedoheptulose 1,7-bisphosphatase-like protein
MVLWIRKSHLLSRVQQVGIKDDRWQYGLTKVVKGSECTIKAQSISSHPLVKQNQPKVPENLTQKRVQQSSEEETNKIKTRMKRDDLKKENTM